MVASVLPFRAGFFVFRITNASFYTGAPDMLAFRELNFIIKYQYIMIFVGLFRDKFKAIMGAGGRLPAGCP
jgi:hypothetical protein